MRRILKITCQIVELGVQDPAKRGVVDWNAQNNAKDLREEYGSLRCMSVVANTLVLQHVLCSVPGITCDCAVDAGTCWIPVTAGSLHHSSI